MAIYTTKIITSEQELMDLQPAWDRLYEQLQQTTTVFQSWSWHYSWWKAFQHHFDALTLGVIADRHHITGLLPLVIQKPSDVHVHTRSAIFAGAWHSDYQDWLVEPAVAHTFLANIFHQLRLFAIDTIRFTDVPPWSSLPQTLASVAKEHRLMLTSGISELCPYVALPSSWQAYLATRTPKMRKNIVSAQKQVAKQQTAFHICTSYADLSSYQAHVFALHDRWWAIKQLQTGQQSVFADPEARSFLSDVMERLFAKEMLHLSLFQDSNAVISAFVAFLQRNTLAYYASGVNPDYASRSPGSAHIAALIGAGIEQGYKEFDFLRGDEAYKFRWNTGGHETRWYECRLT